MYLEPKITLKTSSLSPCLQIKLNQVSPANKIHPQNHFFDFFLYFCRYIAPVWALSIAYPPIITGASLSNDLSMKKILFLHGFFATGSCPMARALKEAFEGTAVVLTPDLPLHPKEALKEIRSIIDREQPDLLLGNSCGSFLAQMLAPVVGIPALLGNPYFMMTEFLKERIGEHEYKAPRRDGNQRLVIDEALIEEFAELEAVQFDHCNPYYKDRVWGLFGEQDALAHFSPLFLQHYNQAFHFPGGHTPTEQEVKTWYAPLAQKMLMEFSANF